MYAVVQIIGNMYMYHLSKTIIALNTSFEKYDQSSKFSSFIGHKKRSNFILYCINHNINHLKNIHRHSFYIPSDHSKHKFEVALCFLK